MSIAFKLALKFFIKIAAIEFFPFAAYANRVMLFVTLLSAFYPITTLIQRQSLKWSDTATPTRRRKPILTHSAREADALSKLSSKSFLAEMLKKMTNKPPLRPFVIQHKVE